MLVLWVPAGQLGVRAVGWAVVVVVVAAPFLHFIVACRLRVCAMKASTPSLCRCDQFEPRNCSK